MLLSRIPYPFLTAGLILALASAGCNRGATQAPGQGAMPPTPVEIVTLTPQPIAQTTEFVGTVKSRRSTTIQPQAEGFLRRILVKSGDRVKTGTPLMEIDSKPQEAAIAAQEAVKAQREIDVNYARQEADRAKQLLAAGAASQMEADRATNALAAAEAQVKIVDEQIRQLRTDLAYYHVTAPTDGIIGDIPVREGDRVTKATPLTTIDANEELELYLNVPVQQAPSLKIGLPVRMLDERGGVIATSAINFISPSVEPETQTVLAKVPISRTSGFRTAQFVRAQIVWSENPTLTVPVTSVIRINGQYFVYVAEQASAAPAGGAASGGAAREGAEGGAAAGGAASGAPAGPPPSGLVARQRAVSLGTVVNNSYVVNSGLKPGEQLIVSGIQKIGDGAPVAPAPAGQSQGTPGQPGASGSPASSSSEPAKETR
jgi:RND family efflux transporter MFP subunit